MVDLSKMTKKDLGKLFDHSVLPKFTQEKDIIEGCEQAIKYNCAAFYSSAPYYAPLIVQELAGTDILIGAGIGFPFGATTSQVKAYETEIAVKSGCNTVDVVMNIGALKDKRYDVVEKEIKDFVSAANGALTKVILEVCFLTDKEIDTGSKIIAQAGADWCKTSSGQFDGPSMKQFLIMKNAVKDTDIGLKVAGVKFPRPQNAYAFIMAGAELIGTRAAPQIIDALDMVREIGMVPEYQG